VLGIFREIEQRLGALKTDLFFKLVRPGALTGAELSDAPSPKRWASIRVTAMPARARL